MSLTLAQLPLSLPKTQADWGAYLTAMQNWQTSILSLAPSTPYNPIFQSGQVQYAGPGGGLAGSNNLIFGLALPNPGGTPGPALLLGSGGGNGSPVWAWIIQDQAFDSVTPGNNLGITAGETQPAGIQPGGELFIIAGASFGGRGGVLQLQGGTSFNGPGGFGILQGGNSTNGPAGDAFVTGGQNGTAGANVHLIMTTVNGISGVVRIRNNSTILWDFYPDGSIFSYLGGGFGTSGQSLKTQGAGLPAQWG